MRDDFSDETKRIVAARVGYRCSKPDCRTSTSGPQTDPVKTLNVGVAAHVTAASQGGPRYDPSLSPDERKHPRNAIWLCQTCAKLVDNDEAKFSAVLLRSWKRAAELEALAHIGKAASAAHPSHAPFSPEELGILIAAAAQGEIYKLRSEQVGEWVRAGSYDFLDPEDPAAAATYLEALHVLLRRGLVTYQVGTLFTLTGSGFKVARALCPEGQ